jgi:hypothetical protein
MKVGILACGLAMLLPPTAQARPSQWWYVTQGADKVLFVDVESIVRDGDTVRYESSQVLREPGNPAASLRASMIGDCRDNTETWDLVLRYGADDERLDKTALSYAGPNAVEAGSVGAAQLQFVCTANRAQTGGFPLADLHERMRADPNVPVIRSTAPSPNTFGTPQSAIAGHAVVPPRDYAKGLGIPAAENYDTIESGTVYDIAYLGIEKGELAFDLRGYSIDDLAHASSAQTMRFPTSQKTIHIRDIEITVLAATPQDLRFRASLAPTDGDDSPFVCADPACTRQ